MTGAPTDSPTVQQSNDNQQGAQHEGIGPAKTLADLSKSSLSNALSAASRPAAYLAQNGQLDNVLSPRASLDLTVHPESSEVCVVRITADPERAHYPASYPKDSLIEDPTAAAFLEHAFQPSMQQPVFHVHMPSRRGSLHGQEEASDHGSESGDLHQQFASSQLPNGDSQLTEPLLSSDGHLHSGHAHGAADTSLWQRWKILLSNPQAVPFFAMSLLMGFGTGVLSTYLFLYLDELGESGHHKCICSSMPAPHCLHTPFVSKRNYASTIWHIACLH